VNEVPGKIIFGTGAVARLRDTFRFSYRTEQEARSKIQEYARALTTGSIKELSTFAAIVELRPDTTVGLPGNEDVRDPSTVSSRWLSGVLKRRELVRAAEANNMTPLDWYKRGGYLGTSQNAWRTIQDAMNNFAYAVYMARDTNPRKGHGVDVYSKPRRSTRQRSKDRQAASTPPPAKRGGEAAPAPNREERRQRRSIFRRRRAETPSIVEQPTKRTGRRAAPTPRRQRGFRLFGRRRSEIAPIESPFDLFDEALELFDRENFATPDNPIGGFLDLEDE
jgi:hypothetical protein